MPEQITNYQCPNCLAPLHFNGKTGTLDCDYCDSTFTAEEIAALYAQKDEAAAQAQAAAEEKRQENPEAEQGWDFSGAGSEWGEDAAHIRVYNCPSCGAELISEETTAATSCPYCGNPAIIPGKLSGALKPDYIIPFKYEKKQALEALKKHYLKRPFLPKTFKDENHLAEIKGIYVPFWLFNGKVAGSALFDATRSMSRREGDYRVTRTDHYNVLREGMIAFENIPVDGSEKMPDDYMDSLEPFDYRDMTAFSTGYLPGYLADKYDVTAEESSPRADKRAASTLVSSLKNTVNGYQTVSLRQQNIQLYRDKVKYALLPVWTLRTKWNGKEYLFAMNGQTGKMVGDLPVDVKKRRLVFLGIYLLFFVIMVLLLKNALITLFRA